MQHDETHDPQNGAAAQAAKRIDICVNTRAKRCRAQQLVALPSVATSQ